MIRPSRAQPAIIDHAISWSPAGRDGDCPDCPRTGDRAVATTVFSTPISAAAGLVGHARERDTRFSHPIGDQAAPAASLAATKSP